MISHCFEVLLKLSTRCLLIVALTALPVGAQQDVPGRAYLLLDTSKSMSAEVKGSKRGKTRFDVVKTWLIEHAEARLIAGREVVVVPFNTTAGTPKYYRGSGGAATLREDLARLNPSGGTRIWDTLGGLMSSLAEAPPGSSVAIFTDGLDPDPGDIKGGSQNWTEQLCVERLREAWNIDQRYDLDLRVIRWDKETFVTPKPVVDVLLLDSAEITVEAEALRTGPVRKEIRVKMVVSGDAAPGDSITTGRLLLPAELEALAPTLEVRGFLAAPLTKESPEGNLVVSISGSIPTPGESTYAFNSEYDFESASRVLPASERMQRRPGDKNIQLKLIGNAPQLDQLSIQPSRAELVVSQSTDFTIALGGDQSAAGETVKLLVTPPVGVSVGYVDESGKALRWDKGQIVSTVQLPADGSPVSLKLRVRADNAVDGRLIIDASLGASKQRVEAMITASTLTLSSVLKNRDILTTLPDDEKLATSWTTVDAGPLQLSLGEINALVAPKASIKLEIVEESADVQVAFDSSGSTRLSLAVADLPRDVPLFARWNPNATQFARPRIPNVRVTVDGADATTLNVGDAVVSLAQTIAPLDPRFWLLDEAGRPTDIVRLSPRSLSVQSADSVSVRMGWNLAASKQQLNIRNNAAESVSSPVAESNVSGGIAFRNAGAGQFQLSHSSRVGEVSLPIRTGPISQIGNVITWDFVLSGEKSVRASLTATFDTRPVAYAMEYESQSDPAAVRLDQPTKVGQVSLTGIGTSGNLILRAVPKSLPDGVTLSLGAGRSMSSAVSIDPSLKSQFVEVYALLSINPDVVERSALAGKVIEAELIVKPSEDSAVPLVNDEKEKRFNISMTPKVWKIIAVRDEQSLDSIQPNRVPWAVSEESVSNTLSWSRPATLRIEPSGESSEIDSMTFEAVIEPKDASGHISSAGFTFAADGKSKPVITVADIKNGPVGIHLTAATNLAKPLFWPESKLDKLMIRSSDGTMNLTLDVYTTASGRIPLWTPVVGLLATFVGLTLWIRRRNSREEDAAA